MTHDLLVLRWDDLAGTVTLQIRKPGDREPSHVEHVAFANSDDEAHTMAVNAGDRIQVSPARDAAYLALRSLALKLAELDAARAASRVILGEDVGWPLLAIDLEQTARRLVVAARSARMAPSTPEIDPPLPFSSLPPPTWGDRMRLELAFGELEAALAVLGSDDLLRPWARNVVRAARRMLEVGRELGLAARGARIEPASKPGRDIPGSRMPPQPAVFWSRDGFIAGPTYDISGLLDPPPDVIDPLTHDEGEG